MLRVFAYIDFNVFHQYYLLCTLFYINGGNNYYLKINIKINLTCNMVSKLKVKPFHNVNSPELAPVTSLLPSGVHAIQNIGHLILFVAVLTNLVVTQLIGLSW